MLLRFHARQFQFIGDGLVKSVDVAIDVAHQNRFRQALQPLGFAGYTFPAVGNGKKKRLQDSLSRAGLVSSFDYHVGTI